MLYTVGEIAKILGVSASTLRYYDKMGLLPFVERSRGGVRMFTDRDYEWLKVIECLKKSGLSIKDIKAYTDLVSQGNDSLPERLNLLQTRRNALKQEIKDMQEALELLEFKCWYYTQAVQDHTDEKVQALSIDEIPEQFRNIKNKMNNIQAEAE